MQIVVDNLAPEAESTETIDTNATGLACGAVHRDIHSDAKFERVVGLLADYIEKYADRVVDAVEAENARNKLK